MDIFNTMKVFHLENEIRGLKLEIRIKDAEIAALRKDLAPYMVYKYREGCGNNVRYQKYTLKDAEQEICLLKLLLRVLEGELGSEKTELAKKKYEALPELVKNNTKPMIGGDIQMRVPFMMLGMILLTGWLFYIGHVSAGMLALFATIPIALVESD